MEVTDALKEGIGEEDDRVEYPDPAEGGSPRETGGSDRHEEGGEGKKKVKRRRRRVRTGANQYRAFEVRIGAKRIFADAAEISHGCITYWVDNTMTTLPIKRRVDVITHGRPRPQGVPVPVRSDDDLLARERSYQHERNLDAELEAEMGPL